MEKENHKRKHEKDVKTELNDKKMKKQDENIKTLFFTDNYDKKEKLKKELKDISEDVYLHFLNHHDQKYYVITSHNSKIHFRSHFETQYLPLNTKVVLAHKKNENESWYRIVNQTEISSDFWLHHLFTKIDDRFIC